MVSSSLSAAPNSQLTSALSFAARLPVLLPLPSQPQPIVLDTHLRTPTSARLMKNHHMRITPRPIILCEGGDQVSAERKEALEASGATVKELQVDGELLHYIQQPTRGLIALSSAAHGRLSLELLLKQEYVGQSLMVEGGASVISAFLASGLVDLIVITIAPVLVGDGVSMLREGVSFHFFGDGPIRLTVSSLGTGHPARVAAGSKKNVRS